MWYEDYPTMYKPIPSLPSQGIYLNGYLQSSKYFYTDEIKKEIKELVRPSPQLMGSVQEMYRDLLDAKERVVVVHARRTDYITHKEVHNPLDASYYVQAIRNMLNVVPNPIFLLTSDDNMFWDELRESVPELFAHEHIILNPPSELHAYALLQQFRYFVMANSTFMWWCVWMADARKVIAPARWFGPRGPACYDDIYEEGWERI
jgi:hypothetical protein